MQKMPDCLSVGCNASLLCGGKRRTIRSIAWLFGFFLLCAQPMLAQTTAPADAKAGQRVKVIHSKELIILQGDSANFQKLYEKVELRQGDVFMYCDSAIIENSTQVYANGNVVIQQGDSLSVFADRLTYDGTSRIAYLEGNVILVNIDQKLFTDELEYDLNTRVARYATGATLASDSLQLTSVRGFYYAKDREAYFTDSVEVNDPRFSLKADTLRYQVPTKKVFFIGPTVLNTDSSRIYCESGFYDTGSDLAEFSKNAQYRKADQQAVADTIFFNNRTKIYELKGNALVEDSLRLAKADFIRYDDLGDQVFLKGNARYREDAQDIQSEEIQYNEKTKTYSTRGRSVIADPPQILQADSVDFDDDTGLGKVRGNVVWQDTTSNYAIYCNAADYDKPRDSFKAFGGAMGRPELINVLDGDSLFLSSDTLVSFRPQADSLSQDTSRRMWAYGRVRMFKSDFQAICDSMVYRESDSLFVLSGSPVIWADTSQFTADTIFLYLKNNQIHRILLRGNAFITVLSDAVFFNQIKGREVLAYFAEEALQRMDASGNAEVIYYAKDDTGAYVGVNQTACSEMIIRMKDNEVNRITFLTEPDSKLTPMGKADHNALRLKGFRYVKEGRPLKREDIFVVVQEN